MSKFHVVDSEAAARDGRAVTEWAGVRVAEGHIVKTGYVLAANVVMFAQQHQLSPAAVERAYCRHLELGDDQAWPPPTGYWRDNGGFVLTDGRTRFLAAMML